MPKVIIYCQFCGAELRRVSKEEFSCPTCKELSFSEVDKKVADPRDKDIFQSIETRVDIELAIKRLPENQRKIAKLFCEGYTWREIIDKTGTYKDLIRKTINDLKVQMTKKPLSL